MKRIHLIRSVAIAVAAVGIFAAGSAMAQTATGTLNVQATVTRTCLVGAATLNFGAYNPTTGLAVDGSTTFTLTCTRGTAYTIALSNGSHWSGTERQMSNGTDNLAYRLFTDAARTTQWNTTNTLPGTALGRVGNIINVYGTILANQDPADSAATFTDAVTITVTY